MSARIVRDNCPTVKPISKQSAISVHTKLQPISKDQGIASLINSSIPTLAVAFKSTAAIQAGVVLFEIAMSKVLQSPIAFTLNRLTSSADKITDSVSFYLHPSGGVTCSMAIASGQVFFGTALLVPLI